MPTEDLFDLFESENVHEIRGSIRKYNHTLSEAVLKFIYEQKLFKLFVPDRFNGRMTPLPEALKIFEDSAFIDGSFGWSVCIGAGGGYFTGYLTPELAERLISPREWVIAGNGAPSGNAKPVDDGYEVSGRWKYCSGANYATMFTANCHISGHKDTVKSFVFMPDEVEVIEDWQAYGMKATAGHSIKVERLFVPDERVFDLGQLNDDYGYPIYSFPFLLFAQFSFAAVVLGIWRHFIEESDTITNEAESRWNQEAPNRFPFVRSLIGEQREKFDDATDVFYGTADTMWKKFKRDQALSEELQDKGGALCNRLAELAFESSSKLFYYLGMRAVMENEPVNRIWRDLTTAVQHILLKDY